MRTTNHSSPVLHFLHPSDPKISGFHEHAVEIAIFGGRIQENEQNVSWWEVGRSGAWRAMPAGVDALSLSPSLGIVTYLPFSCCWAAVATS
jgi:hypothetical protein